MSPTSVGHLKGQASEGGADWQANGEMEMGCHDLCMYVCVCASVVPCVLWVVSTGVCVMVSFIVPILQQLLRGRVCFSPSKPSFVHCSRTYLQVHCGPPQAKCVF